jgi:hypothetical protein
MTIDLLREMPQITGKVELKNGQSAIARADGGYEQAIALRRVP